MYTTNIDKEYYYLKSNEDQLFYDVSDRIVDIKTYGTMYVSETFVRQQLRKIGVRDNQYFKYPKGLGHLQDIYVITKEKIFDNSLEFSAFP